MSVHCRIVTVQALQWLVLMFGGVIYLDSGISVSVRMAGVISMLALVFYKARVLSQLRCPTEEEILCKKDAVCHLALMVCSAVAICSDWSAVVTCWTTLCWTYALLAILL